MNISHGSGRLTLSAALSRNSSLDSSVSSSVSQTKSASVAKAEREIKTLKDENKKLRKDLDDLRSLYNQITTENSHEKFDERRMTVLKSQVIQLERQVLLMSEALSSRSVTLSEVENALSWLADKWRYYIGLEIKGPEVNVKRSDLTHMVETAESARIKLYKNIENTSTDRLAKPLVLLCDFLKPDKQDELTLLDVASGRGVDHLNLKNVGKLETKLASLYRELTTLHELMDSGSYMTMSNHMSSMIRDRTSTQLLKSCAMMKDVCADLMSVSLLYPSAPWPPLKRCCIKDMTWEKVMKHLPVLPRSKVVEVHRVIEALLKAVNYRHYMATQEVKSLKEDMKFHKSVYNLQISYIESLFNVVRDGYVQFEQSTNDIVVKPLKEILNAYEDLHSTASEGALKEFLTKFKQNSEQLQSVVEKLENTDSSSENGTGALSQYGQDFFTSLDKLIAQSQRARDKSAKSREDLHEQQEKLEEELRNILDEQELKYKEHFIISSDIKEKDDGSSSFVSDNHQIEVDNNKTERKSKQKHRSIDSENQENDGDDTSRRKRTSKDDREIDNKFRQKEWIDIEISTDKEEKDFQREFEDEEICVNINERKRINKNMEGISSRMEMLDVSNKNKEFEETENIENNVIDSLPPQGNKQAESNKPKKKRKYIPNTFVPNRTLQLRRSGSLSRLSDSSEQNLCDSEPLPSIKRSDTSVSVDEDRSRNRNGPGVRRTSESVDRSLGIKRSESVERRTLENNSVSKSGVVQKKPPFR